MHGRKGSKLGHRLIAAAPLHSMIVVWVKPNVCRQGGAGQACHARGRIEHKTLGYGDKNDGAGRRLYCHEDYSIAYEHGISIMPTTLTLKLSSHYSISHTYNSLTPCLPFLYVLQSLAQCF
jgi:hypothetical protein